MVLSRRDFLKLTGAFALSPFQAALAETSGVVVNDVHSQLNRTIVERVSCVKSMKEIQESFKRAAKSGDRISLCGGRHAGGGQQFGENTTLLDTLGMNRILRFDREKGFLEVEAGIRWPELLEYLREHQGDSKTPWGIAQKQTGTDLLTIGGTLGANAHGQGLKFKPFVQDIESFVLIDASGKAQTCSRSESAELFRLAVGGYGLFGVVYSVTLRLVPRMKVKREAQLMDVSEVKPAVRKCMEQGYPYGDFQFDIDEKSDGFLKNGVFNGYRLVDADTPLTARDRHLSIDDWVDLVYGAHTDKRKTFDLYAKYHLDTSGMVDWADVWQTCTYRGDYHHIIDERLRSKNKATEILTELYIPEDSIYSFMDDARKYFLKNGTDIIFSTIRFIEKDDETFLPWAKQRYACIIFNLHTEHTSQGIEKSKAALQKLIDYSIKYGGSYYLTYHRYARKDQVLSCYPQFKDFLKAKLKYDPDERIQSNWYRHYKSLFA